MKVYLVCRTDETESGVDVLRVFTSYGSAYKWLESTLDNQVITRFKEYDWHNRPAKAVILRVQHELYHDEWEIVEFESED